jgi:hypothetical protein
VTRIFISWAGADTPLVSGLSAPLAITDHDPSFSLDAFVPFAQAVFLRVNRARAAGQLDEVRRLLADGLWQEFQAEGPAPGRAGLTVEGAQVMAAGQDGTWDTVLVRFTARQPGRRGRMQLEDWTFQRPVAAAPEPDAATAGSAAAAGQPAPAPGAQTDAADPGTGEECPVCGAPLSLTDEGTCRYCGAAARGGLGGWRLVRTAAVQAPQAVSSGGPVQRTGCILAIVILAVALVPTVLALVLTGVIAGFVQHTVRDVPGVAGGLPGQEAQVSGHGSFSGAVTGDTDGTLAFFGGGSGGCASRAKHVSGFSFTDIESSDGGRKVLATRVSLPAGVEGPGTYDLARTPLQVSANYAFSPDRPGAGSQPEAQVWQVQPGQTRAVLTVRPDGSGSLTVSSLAATVPQAEGNSLGQPLSFNESFSCS